MGFSINKAPARITSFAGKEQAARKSCDEAESLPPRVVSFVVSLTISTKENEQELAELFPGIDFLIRAMAGSEIDIAQDCKRHKSLGEVTIKLSDEDGEEVLSLASVKTKGKPVARIAPRGDHVEVPISVECSLTDDQFMTVARQYLGADVVASVCSTQMDIADVIEASAVEYDDEPKKRTVTRKKGKVSVALDEAN